ncbi:YopX family protein [Bacteroides xylanisolvens]|jgi:uncharacterized phage protein (TIGR01671 family)|uniref:YopX family protein n=1 Tax=Bacteroides xylanisolvens TaxID=371601 RepID=UPI0032BF2423
MKREIKFRGKRIDNKKWVYGFLADEDYINDIDSIDLSSIEVDIDTVGQFTGLFDKNGKEIYEGDIIKGFDITIEVWYSEDRACFIAEMKEPQNHMMDILGGYDTERMEIIGNIYDNPDLIKEE